MKKIFNSYIKYILFAVSLLPILWLSFYNFPSADDYSFARSSYRVYVSGGSFLDVLSSVFDKVGTMYQTWQGNYSGVFLMTLSPMLTGGKLYFLGTILGIGMLIFGVLFLLYQLCVKAFDLDRGKVISIGLLTLFTMLQCMPSGMVRVEGLYWYNSTIYYTFMQGMAYVFIGLLISNLFEESRCRVIRNTVVAIVLAIILGGANYLTAIICGIVSFLAIVIAVLKRVIKYDVSSADESTNDEHDSKSNKSWFMEMLQQQLNHMTKANFFNVLPAIIFFICFAISIVAPGNSLREDTLGGFNPVKSVLISFYYVFSVAMSEWTNWAVCGLFILSIPLWWKAGKESRHDFRYPLIAVVILLCFNAATITPALYATGNISAGRIQCLFWIQYVLLMELAIGYLVGFARKYIAINDMDVQIEKRLYFFAVVSFAMISLLCIIPDRTMYVGVQALGEIVSGTASAYQAENEARLELLSDTDLNDVVLEPHSYYPGLLFHSDITTDADDWTNKAIAEYYAKNSVVIGE